MNITFIGSGYVGLVSGIMMSYLGHNVTCLDTDTSKIAKLKSGILPLYEPGLEKYLLSSLKAGKLKFTDKYDIELQKSQAVFITVGTPPLPSGEANLQYVFESVENISKWINKECLVIIKSTVPPTTCNKIQEKLNLSVASNPEFLREGSAVEDFINPDRIVIGVNDRKAEEIFKEIYSSLINRPLRKLAYREEFEGDTSLRTAAYYNDRVDSSTGLTYKLPLEVEFPKRSNKGVEIISTDTTTAELIKYASNSFLATKIAFTNELANLCEKTGADIQKLSLGVGSDQRIGKEFLKAGPGFGGSCFPKDILALSYFYKNHSINCEILDAVISSNQQRPYDIATKIEALATDKNILILGLTYKANTDDIRSSPAIKIIEILLEKGFRIKAFDPMGIKNAKKYLNHENLLYIDSIEEASNDVIVITTEWPEFKELNWDKINTKIVIDLRNILDKNLIEKKGIKYYAVGLAS